MICLVIHGCVGLRQLVMRVTSEGSRDALWPVSSGPDNDADKERSG